MLGLLLLSVPAICIVTAVIVGLQGQAFEASSASGAAERIFLAVAGVGALVAIIAGVASASKVVVWAQSG
ncbi:MAG: hypothetical protein HGA45_03330 [Chloroflexales bacterium]|nr:hypothetical protein [Chloroflexales bacterium]